MALILGSDIRGRWDVGVGRQRSRKAEVGVYYATYGMGRETHNYGGTGTIQSCFFHVKV